MLPSLLWMLMLCHLTDAIPIDNGVYGQPDIVCLPDRVKILTNVKNPFKGNVYVKGLYYNKECREQFPHSREIVFTVQYRGYCSQKVQRRREANPPGVSYRVTVIVQFHPLFLTKVDRAYSVSCFYQETQKIVTQALDVSMLPTSPIVNSQPMPTCTYQVLAGDINGREVRYARIGDKLVHKWTCTGGKGASGVGASISILASNQGMLVHSCFVSDGVNQQQNLLDKNGCSHDPVALGDLTYSRDLQMAWVQVHAFKFADRMLLNFKCQISICNTIDNGCEGTTPPRCVGAVSAQRPATQYQTTPQRPYVQPRIDQSIKRLTYPPTVSPGYGTLDEAYGRIPTAYQYRFEPSTRPPIIPTNVVYSGPYIPPEESFVKGPDNSGFIPYRSRRRRAVKEEPERPNSLQVSTEDFLVFSLEDPYPEVNEGAAELSNLSHDSSPSMSHEDCTTRLMTAQILVAVFLSLSITMGLVALVQRRYYLEKLRKDSLVTPMVGKHVKFADAKCTRF